jgi:hypothetical protein
MSPDPNVTTDLTNRESWSEQQSVILSVRDLGGAGVPNLAVFIAHQEPYDNRHRS